MLRNSYSADVRMLMLSGEHSDRGNNQTAIPEQNFLFWTYDVLFLNTCEAINTYWLRPRETACFVEVSVNKYFNIYQESKKRKNKANFITKYLKYFINFLFDMDRYLLLRILFYGNNFSLFSLGNASEGNRFDFRKS